LLNVNAEQLLTGKTNQEERNDDPNSVLRDGVHCGIHRVTDTEQPFNDPSHRRSPMIGLEQRILLRQLAPLCPEPTRSPSTPRGGVGRLLAVVVVPWPVNCSKETAGLRWPSLLTENDAGCSAVVCREDGARVMPRPGRGYPRDEPDVAPGSTKNPLFFRQFQTSSISTVQLIRALGNLWDWF
jgi:hypothetical protein